jgi:hypothetical protein
MPAMPRENNKAKEIAYNILGVPACLEDDNTRKSTKPPSKVDGHLKIPQNNQDSRRPGV